MIKRILCFIFILTVFTSTLNVSAYTGDAPLTSDDLLGLEIKTSGNYKYVLNDSNKAVIVEVLGNPKGELTLPTWLDSYPVVAFWGNAFKNCKHITSLIIPDGIQGCKVSSVLRKFGSEVYKKIEIINEKTKLPENIRHIEYGNDFQIWYNINLKEYKSFKNPVFSYNHLNEYHNDSDYWDGNRPRNTISNNMELFSLIFKDPKMFDIFRSDFYFIDSPIALRYGWVFMYLMLGNQCGNEFQRLINNKDEIRAFKILDHEFYNKDFLIPGVVSTELGLARLPEGLENENGIDTVISNIKNFVTLLGYKTEAENRGGLPGGYLSVANEIGLTKNMNFNSNDEIGFDILLELANNALDIPLCLTQQELSSGQRDPNRFRYTSSEPGEICNGNGPSGRNETLLSFHFNSVLAKGVLKKGATGYTYHINKLTNLKGKEIPNTIGSSVDVSIGEMPYSELFGEVESNAVIQLNHNGKYDLLAASITPEYTLIATNENGSTEGYATINNEQTTGLGDYFEFTAITPITTNQISLLADLHNGEKWHEIPYDYLKQNYGLNSYVNNYNEKVWTCRFKINDVGCRTFNLRADGLATNAYANVTVINNPENVSQSEIGVTLNGTPVKFDVPPQIINDRTMIPLRAVAEAFGAEVSWNPEGQTIAIKGPIKTGKFSIHMNLAVGRSSISYAQFDNNFTERISDGQSVNLDSPPIIVNDRTLVPIRAIAEIFGYKVGWDNDNRCVIIS